MIEIMMTMRTGGDEMSPHLRGRRLYSVLVGGSPWMADNPNPTSAEDVARVLFHEYSRRGKAVRWVEWDADTGETVLINEEKAK